MGEQHGVCEVQTHGAAKVSCCAPLGLRARPATFAVMVAPEGVLCAHSDPQAKRWIPCQRYGRANAPLPFDLRLIRGSLRGSGIRNTFAARWDTLGLAAYPQPIEISGVRSTSEPCWTFPRPVAHPQHAVSLCLSRVGSY
jgi:hypothetical protein